LRGTVKLEELRSIQHHHQPIPLSDAGRSPGSTGAANAGHGSAPISLEWLCIGQQRLTPGFDHLPLAIIGEIYRATSRLRDAGHLGKEELLVIDADLRNLNEIMGGCERILKTPIPYTYSLFLKKFVFFFILLLPLGFAALFGYMSVPLTMFVFYVLVSLEIIAEEIEEPFGEDTNDLPTDKISETIRRNVDEAMGLVGASD
jgi:predicted membrane chloride channel (bestrophin family)